MKPHSLALGAVLLCVTATAWAQDMAAAAFAPARAAAVADETAQRDWHGRVLLPAFGGPYSRIYQECTTGAAAADAQPFSFVVVIAADGTVQQLLADRSTRVWSCMRGKLAFERLPAPPAAPFHLLMHQRFRETAPQ
ncbi:MAG: hypothetical protein RR101_10195 [Burkholderiaceae bacterium]